MLARCEYEYQVPCLLTNCFNVECVVRSNSGLEKRAHRFARYANDLVILCKSKRSAQRTLMSVSRFLEGCMKLNVNEVKTHFVLEGVKKYRRSGV